MATLLYHKIRAEEKKKSQSSSGDLPASTAFGIVNDYRDKSFTAGGIWTDDFPTLCRFVHSTAKEIVLQYTVMNNDVF